ncbi:MAG: hypothetical protein BGO49_08090 [Planctomycetales bacterium 71-10]|nr:MAG: hypothetical protein BGO49_08090 [Planctomycetales bacterium 71-10]
MRVEENADLGIETSSPEEYSISSYGADYLVDGLVRRLRDKSIIIPKYQRRYVWKIDRASRFVESLLLNLPVPAIFMMREEETGKLLVIDGQQRLLTLQYYYEGIFKPDERAFKLCGLRSRFEGRSRESLDERDRIALDDSIIHAIIVKQESPPASAPAGVGPSAVYDIFERLNTGGVQLFPQEIRSCIFHGKFIDLLDRLNKDAVWRRLFGGKPSSRLRDQELILRFLALYHDADRYAKPMKEFLNRFAEEHRKLRDDEAARFAKLFEDMVRTIDSTLGAEAFRTKSTINAALFDAVAVGVAKRLAAGPVSDPTDFAVQLQALKGNAEFVTFIESGTTSETSVAKRLALAIEAFASMP